MLRSRVLHALSDSCHIQSMRQINDSTHDGVGARVCQYIADQVLIDFDFIDGQLAQVGQCRVAAAEIVVLDVPGVVAAQRYDLSEVTVPGAMIRQLQHAGRLSRTHNAILIYLVHMGRRDVEEHTKDL
jgi:hypothetical protein